MFEENTYDTKKAKEVLAKVDKSLLLIQKILFWLIAFMWFISIFDSFLNLYIKGPSSTGGFIFWSLLMFTYVIGLCISKVVTLIAGAIIRLVEINEHNKI